jgi:serine/threonine-protein kinase RsbW
VVSCSENQRCLLLHYRMPSQLEAFASLAAEVERVLALWPSVVFSVTLCLDELITNTVLYGLKSSPDHWIELEISQTPSGLEIVITDDAPPFDPFSNAPPPDLGADLEARPIGGLGIHLVRQMMDKAYALPCATGNRIVLEKAFVGD